MAQGGRIDYTIGFTLDKAGLKELKDSLLELQSLVPENILSKSGLSKNSKQYQQELQKLQEVKKAADAIGPALQKSFNTRLGVSNVQTFTNEINKTYGSTTKLMNALNQSGVVGQKVAAQLSLGFLTARTNIQKSETILDKMGTTLGNTIKWTFSSSLINRFTGAIQQAVGYVKHLDTSLNDIRIVTGKSADEMERFAVQANKTAQALGKTTTDATEAALIYYQQGLSDEEAQARMETTLKAANVTGQSTAAVSEELTAVWNGYKVATEETEAAVDKLAAVAATTASDLQELSTGMSKVASAANAMGVDMDQLNAQIATIISVTRQAPESVGTALKTIYARLADLKLGDTDEDGLGLGDVSGTLDKVGIAVLDANGDLREMGDVIEDVAAKWNTWTSAQQTAIAEVMAGKRQYNNLVALFENWDMYSSALDTSRNSLGTLQNQQDIYMESTEAHINQLKAEWEDLYDSLLDSKTINNVTDFFTKLLSTVTDFIDVIGGGSGVLLHFGGILTNLFSGKIASTISETIQRITDNKNLDKLLNARLDFSKANMGIDQQSFPSEKISEFYQTWGKYAKDMTNEQREQYMIMTEQVGKLAQENAEQKQSLNIIDAKIKAKQEEKLQQEIALDNAKQELQILKEQSAEKIKTVEANLAKNNAQLPGGGFRGDKDYSALFSKVSLANSWNDDDNDIIRIKDDIENLIDTANNAHKAIKNMLSTEPSKRKMSDKGVPMWDPNDWTKWSKTVVKNIDVAKIELKSLSEAGIIDENKYNKLLTVLNGSVTQKGEVNKTNWNSTKKALEEILNLSEKTSEEYKQALEVLSQSFDPSDQLAKIEVLEAEIEELNQAKKEGKEIDEQQLRLLEQQKHAAEESLAVFQKQQSIKAITNIASGLMQVGSLLTTLQNLSTNLFSGEGTIASYLTGLGSVAMSTVMIISTVKKALEAMALSGVAAFQKIALAIINTPVIGQIAAIVAAVTALGTVLITGFAKKYQQAMKQKAEADRDAANMAAEHTKALKTEKDHLDEIINKYDELNQKIKENTITNEDAKEEIYDLCKQYGLQRLAVQALTTDYENLKDVLEEAQDAANETLLQGIEDQKEKEKQAIKSDIWQGMKGAQRDMRGGEQTIDLYGLGGTNTGKRKGFEEALESLGLKVDSSGHINLNEFVEVAATNEAELYEILNSYNIKASNQLRTILKEQKENIATYRSLLDEESDIRRNQQAKSVIELNNINSIQDYQNAQSKLLNDKDIKKTFEDATGVVNEEALKNWVNSYLAGIDEIKQYAQQADIAESLYDDSKFSKEEINKQIEKRSQVEIDFLVNNKSLAEAYKDLDTFFDNYKEEIDQLQTDYSLITISTVIQNHSGDNFSEEEIDALYSDSNMTNQLGLNQEEFTKASYDKQLSLIADYYNKANQLETESQELKRKGLIEENNLLIQQTEAALYVEQNKYNSLNQQLEGFEEGIQSVNDKWSEQRDLYGGFLNELGDYSDVIDKIAESNKSNEDTLSDLSEVEQEYIKWIAEELGIGQEDVIQKIKLTKELKNSSKAISTYTEKISSLNKQNEKLVNGSQKDWTNMLKNTKAMLDLTNKGIDNLQGAYSSLTSIMESYNEEGTLNMDNLQTFLNMDTEYLSALQIENGQMTLNEEALKQIALARLDEAEAEAYQQAIGELHDQQVRDGIAASGEASTANTTLGNAALQAGEAARQGAAGWREYWAAALNREGVANDKVSQQIGQALYNKLQAIDSVRQRIMSGDLGGALGGGSKSSGGGGSEKEADHEEYLEREEDIYHQINQELEQIESTLGRIQKLEDHSWGASAKANLEEENKLLEKQIEKLHEKKALQERDLSTRRKQLEDVGISFTEDGSAMTNAEAQLNALYAHYNTMVDTYNAMSAAEQETYKAQLEAEKDRIKKIEDKINDYESTFSDYQSVLDEIMDKHFEQIEKQVETFNNDIEVHLELDKAKEEWNDFWYDVVKDVEDTDFAGQISKSIDALKILIGTTTNFVDSQVYVLTNHLNDTIAEVRAQIASASRGGADSMFGDDSALSKETLKDYRDKLMEALTTAKGKLDDFSDNYLKMLDAAQEKIDEQVSGWESISSHLEHNAKLIQMISGENSYESLNKVYEQQYKNNLNLIETQRTSKEFWQNEMAAAQARMATVDKDSKAYKTYAEDYKKASENYKKAVADLDKTVEEALEDLETWKKNQLDAINHAFDMALSNNVGLEMMEKEWKLVNEQADRYLDNVERALGMEDLNNEFNKVLDTAGLSIKAQQELNKMRDEEIAKLNQKVKISQFDLDEIKARLEIRKQEIALEEAQRNKSNLRLRRDSQGNYTYQYTGDDNKIEEASEGLISAKREWYELVKKRNIDLSNSLLDLYKNMESEMQNLGNMHFESEEERKQAELEIIKKYEDMALEIVGDKEEAKKIFFQGTAEFFSDVENNTILPQWNTTIESMIDSWSNGGEESFIGAVEAGINKIDSVQQQYVDKTHQILNQAGVDYLNMKENGIDPTIESLEELVETNEDLADTLENTSSLLEDQARALEECEDGYNRLKDAAVDAVREAEATLEQLSQTVIRTNQQVQASIESAKNATSLWNTVNSSTNPNSPSNSSNNYLPSQTSSTDNQLKYVVYRNNTNGSVDSSPRTYTNKTDVKKFILDALQHYLMGTVRIYSGNSLVRTLHYGGTYGSREMAYLKSGGYTGTWSGSNHIDDLKSGKLAVLHQKELVLNETDTSNVLDAVHLLRSISVDKIAESIINAARTSASVLNGVGAGMMQGITNLVQNSQANDNSYRNTTINADFSGVRSADAIYQALMELENYNMQQSFT